MQRSPAICILRIHIRAITQVLFNRFDVSGSGCSVNRVIGIEPITPLAAVFAEEVGEFFIIY